MEVSVSRRGGEVPGQGDLETSGLPSTRIGSIGSNAWLLWKAVLTHAQQDGRQAQRDGVAGWEWEGALVTIEHDLWPAMVSSQRDPMWRASTSARNVIRQYLRDSGNVVFANGNERWRGRGRLGGTWWVRGEWSAVVPPLWTHRTPAAEAATAAVTVSWRCPSCQEPFDSRDSLTEHRTAMHPVDVVHQLPGESLLADVLTCMGDDERMHNADLLTLLAAGNPIYNGLSAIMLGKMLRDAGVHSRPIRVVGSVNGDMPVVRAGVHRTEVEVARAREEDIESEVIVAVAHEEVQQQIAEHRRQSPAEMLRQSVTAIIMENEEQARLIAEQAAELDRLRRQPVSQDLIDKAMAEKNARITELERRLAAARKVIGLG